MTGETQHLFKQNRKTAKHSGAGSGNKYDMRLEQQDLEVSKM